MKVTRRTFLAGMGLSIATLSHAQAKQVMSSLLPTEQQREDLSMGRPVLLHWDIVPRFLTMIERDQFDSVLVMRLAVSLGKDRFVAISIPCDDGMRAFESLNVIERQGEDFLIDQLHAAIINEPQLNAESTAEILALQIPAAIRRNYPCLSPTGKTLVNQVSSEIVRFG